MHSAIHRINVVPSELSRSFRTFGHFLVIGSVFPDELDRPRVEDYLLWTDSFSPVNVVLVAIGNVFLGVSVPRLLEVRPAA